MNVNLDYKNLTLTLFITIALVLVTPVLFPQSHILFFAPFLIIFFYQKSYIASLWMSLTCGLMLDLLTADTHMGLHAVSYSIATGLLHGQRKNFFADSLSTLPLMTFFFSLLATVFQLVLIYLFERKAAISWQWALTDLVYMPALDSLYAFVLFILPAICLGRQPKRGRDYFLKK